MSTVVFNTNYFKFSPNATKLIGEFAAKHCNDERKAFKLAWQEWRAEKDIKSCLDADVKRIVDMGCKDDVEDKMFKSARYYYRKKIIRTSPNADAESSPIADAESSPIADAAYADTNTETNATVDPEPNSTRDTEAKPRRKNDKIMLKIMDKHIWDILKAYTVLETNQHVCRICPAIAFEDFLKSCEKADDGHKKTYKNRFYNIRKEYSTDNTSVANPIAKY